MIESVADVGRADPAGFIGVARLPVTAALVLLLAGIGLLGAVDSHV